jgi:F1F0 ATPase subunit 2
MGEITMSEIMRLVPALLAGMLLGAIFFGGLWWTVLKGISARQPALWFGLSMLARTGIVLAGFYFVADSDWKRLLLCLFGFIVARIIVTRLTGNANTNRTNTGEVSHAP